MKKLDFWGVSRLHTVISEVLPAERRAFSTGESPDSSEVAGFGSAIIYSPFGYDYWTEDWFYAAAGSC